MCLNFKHKKCQPFLSCDIFIFRLANSPRHVNDNNGCGQWWNVTEDIERMIEGMENGMVTTWLVVILMNMMICLGFTKVLMILAALKVDGLETISPYVLDFYLSLKINDVFEFEACRDSGTGIMQLQWILRRNRLKMEHISLTLRLMMVCLMALAMKYFANIVITEPEVSKSPFMLDSSKFEIMMEKQL